MEQRRGATKSGVFYAENTSRSANYQALHASAPSANPGPSCLTSPFAGSPGEHLSATDTNKMIRVAGKCLGPGAPSLKHANQVTVAVDDRGSHVEYNPTLDN